MGGAVSRLRRASVSSSEGVFFLRFPELQQAILTVGGDEVLVGVVSDADNILLVDLEMGDVRCDQDTPKTSRVKQSRASSSLK